MPDFDPDDRDEIARRFAALGANLPTEAELWRSGDLDHVALEMLFARSARDEALALLPRGAAHAAVLAACLNVARLDRHDQARLLKAIVRHVGLLQPDVTVQHCHADLGQGALRDFPGARAHTTVWLNGYDTLGWILAGIHDHHGMPAVIGRRHDDPWRDVFQVRLNELRDRVDV
ncbi:MAG TPA: hypothetical protein VGX28_12295 [Frankiaceae bacterium]|nr:hypothetical protein [Frankiaceae bacterium]